MKDNITTHEFSVTRQLGKAEEVFTPTIVLGELFYGARRSRRVQEHVARTDEFAARSIGYLHTLAPSQAV